PVDALAVLPARARLGGRDDGALLLAQRQRDVDELAGPERFVAIGEGRLEPDLAGLQIHRVVDEGEQAGLLLAGDRARGLLLGIRALVLQRRRRRDRQFRRRAARAHLGP